MTYNNCIVIIKNVQLLEVWRAPHSHSLRLCFCDVITKQDLSPVVCLSGRRLATLSQFQRASSSSHRLLQNVQARVWGLLPCLQINIK